MGIILNTDTSQELGDFDAGVRQYSYFTSTLVSLTCLLYSTEQNRS